MKCESGSGKLAFVDIAQSDVRPILLGTNRYYQEQKDGKDEEEEMPAHPEEEQVAKDTNRSFVSYPRGKLSSNCGLNVQLMTGIPNESKMEMKSDLHNLIISVLRQYPGLSYFQVSLPRCK